MGEIVQQKDAAVLTISDELFSNANDWQTALPIIIRLYIITCFKIRDWKNVGTVLPGSWGNAPHFPGVRTRDFFRFKRESTGPMSRYQFNSNNVNILFLKYRWNWFPPITPGSTSWAIVEAKAIFPGNRRPLLQRRTLHEGNMFEENVDPLLRILEYF